MRGVDMLNNRDAVIVAYGRTPMARAYKGGLVGTHPVDYAAQTIKGVLAKIPALDTSQIDDVIVGCATPENHVGYNVARLIAQHAGLPDDVPAQTINRFCSSGLQSVATAANAIMAGEMDIIIAGGVERMTDITMEHPHEYRLKTLSDAIPGTYMPMGLTGELVAERYGITREEMEVFAVESHQKAAAAKNSGKFVDEIIPIATESESGAVTLTEDEGIRPSTNLESLSGLKPCFKEDGRLTPGICSQMTDGASFVVIMARETAQRLGLTPIARFVSFALAGLPPEIMGMGPVPAIPRALKKAGLTLDDMDIIELNEAFASQALACINELKLPKEKVNPNGGAIALGHPLGATGTVLICKALSELKRAGGKYAMITMCIGGGMGAAGIFEMEAR